MAEDQVTQLEKRDDKFRRVSELIAAIILSVAALLSSYAGFQGELFDGEQAANYALAEQTRTKASKDEMVAVQFASMDAMLFAKWYDAYAARDRQLEQFYRDRFRPQFKQVFEQWLLTRPFDDPKAPQSPFHMADYFNRSRASGQSLEERANRYFTEGQRANEVSDSYGQAVVIFALALFMGGITQSFDTRRTKMILLSLSAICVVLAAIRIIGLPAIRLY